MVFSLGYEGGCVMKPAPQLERMKNIRPQACGRCGGAAYLDRTDEPEWRCLQCGRTLPPAVIEPPPGRATASAA